MMRSGSLAIDVAMTASLAHAAGELCDSLGTHLRVGDAHQVEQLDGALVGVRLAHAGLVDPPQGLDDLAPTVYTGVRALSGSWKTMATRAADAGHGAVAQQPVPWRRTEP